MVFFLGIFPGKLEDPNYRELYVRWLQFARAFLSDDAIVRVPMLHVRFTNSAKKGDKIYDAIEKFINVRYLLLPSYLFHFMGCFKLITQP